MSEASRRVFEARYRSIEALMLMIAATIWLLFARALARHVWAEFHLAHENPSIYADGPLKGLSWMTLLVAAYHLAPISLGVCWVVRHWLHGRGGPVVVDSQALSVTDWRGRETVVPWGEIVELRATGRGRRAPNYGRLIDVVTADQRMRIPPTAWPQNELVAEIVSRAGLERRRKTWIGMSYTRPSRSENT